MRVRPTYLGTLLVRAFTVKSTYDLIVKDRLEASSPTTHQTWKQIWDLKLHGRNSILYWKLMTSTLPTLDRISKFTSINSENCYLCGEEQESTSHLLLCCLITKLLWWNSPWKIHIDHFQEWDTQQWLCTPTGKGNPFKANPTMVG